MSNLLQCRNITLGYEGNAVVSGLDFAVSDGCYLCVLGENGSGKSTLIKTLLGLKQPMSGTIERLGDMKAGDIGYLPQQTAIQRDFPASVREIVMSGCLPKCGLRPFYTKEEKRLAESTMSRLGITDLASRCYRELSGGQQQRVLLARALCAAQKILLLDEPATGLDPKAQLDLYELISELNRSGVTIIMVSHDFAAATKYASHILHIGAHHQLFFGTTADYLASDVGKLFAQHEAAAEEGTVSENG
ncbi:MAG: metal ABC transporter ATP-binding protein [Ruminiclostridium sp.]|nr:metal ABC transporter ATP-binding protein [Ruminiclostridium sp.]